MTENRRLAQMCTELGSLMKKWGEPSTTPDAGWATLVHLHQDPDPSVSAPDPRDPDGPPVSYPGIDSYFMNPNQGYLTAAGPVQTKLLIAIKNKMVLQGKNWAVTYGDRKSTRLNSSQ